MNTRSIRGKILESTNIWPGFVDVLATLLIVIIFVLMVFTVSQIYLSDAISGRDKALEELRNKINELSKILLVESSEKIEALESLELTEKKLKQESLQRKNLEGEVSKKEVQILSLDQQITNLGSQIQLLTEELQIVANALKIYEGEEFLTLETKGLGEKINKALASRVDQLNKLNEELLLSKNETTKQLQIVEQLNNQLSNKEKALQDQVDQYQKLTNDLIAINESLGLEDASLIEQLEAIKVKNQELKDLNISLIEKENVILDLRNKILQLNNVLSIGEEKQFTQQKEIDLLTSKIKILEKENFETETAKNIEVMEAEKIAKSSLEQVGQLSGEIDILTEEISTLNLALEASERDALVKELQIEDLGERLNKALTARVFELEKYRSEFFGRLQKILGERKDIRVVGDRFIFESELLFDSGSAILHEEGKKKLKQIGLTLKQTTEQIPSDIDWIIQVEGHTDKNPIKTTQYPSNWELSTARATKVIKLLLELGFNPSRLSAAGYGEFYPISEGDSEEELRQNRRIELKLTSR